MNLFPEITPHKTHILQVDDIHKIYIEQSGQPDGIPVIFLHGGPGAGISPKYRQFFDPKIYNIILFDQRGCNRSTPSGHTSDNTTSDLLNDMEAIRNTLGIEKFILFGGSWGATLALLYAELYPQHVLGIILRGSFLARKKDLEWFIGGGVNRIYPHYWQEFLSIFSNEETVLKASRKFF